MTIEEAKDPVELVDAVLLEWKADRLDHHVPYHGGSFDACLSHKCENFRVKASRARRRAIQLNGG